MKFVLLFLLAQITFWFFTKDIKPQMDIVINAPSDNHLKASSLGDDGFYFRYLAFQMQNFGDTYGRITPLKDYDYASLEEWFLALDKLDNQSNLVPAIAGYYYSNTQNKEDVRHIINYLLKHSEYDLANKWWWVAQATYLANHKLNDKKLALEIALKLSSINAPNMPFWALQMPAFIYEQLGEKEHSRIIIEEIISNHKNIPESELNFMRYFIEQRLK